MKKQLCTGIASLLLPFASYGATSQTGAYQRSTARSGLGTEAAIPLLGQQASSPAASEGAGAIDAESLRIVQGSKARELLIIDEAVPDQSTFYRALRPGVAVAKINTDRHGLKQLRAILADHQSLEAVHIVSHAEDGVLHLGNSRVTADSVKADMELFAALTGSVKAGGDLLFYGCNLAATEKGEELLDIFAGNTQLDVAASNDLTGNAEQQGDWELEISRGRIESDLAFSEKSLKDFSSILAPETYNHNDFCTGTGCAYASASHTSSDGHIVFDGSHDVYAYDPGSAPGFYLDYTANVYTGHLQFSADATNIVSFELTTLNFSAANGANCASADVTGYLASGGTASDTFTLSGSGGVTLTNLSGQQITHFRVNASGCDQKIYFPLRVTDFTVDNKQGATDSDGDLTAASGVTEPVGLDTNVDTSGEAVDVFDFTLSDGGTSDGQSLDVSEVRVDVSGTSTDTQRSNITWQLNGPDASNVTGDYDAGSKTITFSLLSISVADGGNETYTINAYYNDNTNLTEDNTIVLSVDGDTDLTVGSSGTQMGSTTVVNNGTGTTIDVTATQLAFATQPAGSVSGNALTTQPVVTAQDDFGNTDVDFSETITLTEASAGSLSNNTRSASDGVATFTDITYTATSDQESFTLTANDQDGVGSNLPTVDANAVTSDVVATQLVFDTQPAPTEVTSDEPTAFTTVPTVSAVDAEGVVDTGYGTDITLSVTDPNDGTLDGTVNSLTATGDTDGDGTTVSLTPASGAATFTDLTLNYSAASLSDDLALSTTSGSLSTAESSALTAVQLPSVTDANISISGATGTDGAYITGDTVTATWDSSASGDDNSDLTGVTVDFSEFGGGAAVTATDSGGVWTATHTITSGNIDATGANVSVTASNVNGDTTTADTTDATLDNEAPALTDDGLGLYGASGNDGIFIINDTLTASWDTSVGGNGNTDIDTVTVDFTEFAGGAAVTATQSGDQWQADLDIEPGSLEADDLNVSFTVTDDAGNSTTLADTSNASLDNQAPSVTGSQPGSETGAADTSVDFVVNFDETVQNLSTGDFTLTTTGSAAGTVDSLSASSGDTITVTVTGVSGDGTLRLDYTGTGATDTAGNTLGSFTSGTEHTVDTEAPDAPGLTFDQDPVTEANADNISLTLAGAETGTSADYTVTSDGGGTAVTGSANITSADQTLTGIDVSGLGDGTLSAEVTLTDDAGNTSSAGTATVAKDANAPVVNSVEATDGSYAEGDTLTIVVELNEDVEVSGTNATLDIDIGPNTRTAGFASELDGVLQFSYTIQADDNTDGNGVTVLASSIALNGATIRDSVGNDADLSFASNSNANAQVDTVQPDETTVSAPSEAVSVNEADYTIAGSHGEDGVVINLYADADEDGVADDATILASATVDGGTWSVDHTLNQNADNALVAVAEDAAGNTAAPVQVPVITHDDIAPDAPTGLTLDAESDSGAENSDGITNITTVDISGTAEAQATLTLSSDLDGEVGTTTANESGNWTLTSDELSEGEHSLTAHATDSAGNTSSVSDALAVTIDVTAPAQPDAPVLDSGSDSGIDDNDQLTNQTTPTITGTAEANAEVTLSNAGGSVGSATADGSGNWSLTSNALSAGTQSLTLVATDLAGNDSAASAPLALVVDTQAPTIQSSTPDGDAASTSVSFTVGLDEVVYGLDVTDFTLTSTDTASGSVESLSSATGNEVVVTVSSISGTGTLRLDYNGTAATDAAGNLLGAFTGGTAHTVDTDAPNTPAVSFDQDPVNTGSADNISLTLSGAEAGAQAEYTVTSDGGGTAVTGSANVTSADQSLTGIDVSGLGDGTLSAEVTLTDDAGNVSDAGTATAAKDANAPVVNSAEATDGHYAEGDTLAIVVELNEDVEVSGTNATLDIDIGPNTRTAGFASELDGVLQFNYTVQADDNTDDNGVTVLADAIALNGDTMTDGAGNDADLSFASNSNANAQVDTIEPETPTVTTPSEAISVNSAEFTFSGSHAENGTTIAFYADVDQDGAADDDTALASATVDGGNWSVDYTLNQNADNALVAIAKDSAGNTAAPVQVPVITHDDIAPDAPTGLTLAAESDSGTDDGDGITNLTTVDINGTAEAQATLTLSSDLDGEVGTTSANESGDWTLTSDELSEGEHALTVVATDAAGNTGGASDALALTIDTTAPTLSDIADQSAPAGQSTGALALQLNDNQSDPADLQLSATSSDTDAVPENNITLAGTDGERTVEVTPAQPGSVTVTLEAEDLAGNRATTSFLIDINTPPTIGGAPPADAVEGQHYEFVPSASDADGDTLTFSIAGQPTWLSFDTETGALSGTPTQGAIGQISDIQISVTDGIASETLAPFSIQVSAGPDSDGDGVSDYQEALDGTDPNDPDDYLDNTPPELTAPTDRVLNAKALYTRVTLAQLLGLDAEAGNGDIDLALDELASDDFDGEGCCNPTVEGMTDNHLLLTPGEHQVVWQAEDRKGNRTEVAQTVYLRPLVSLSKDQTTVEGNRATFSVILNGESPFYPLTVPYTIDEAASSAGTDDHDLSNGTVTFEEGETRVQVSLNIADDRVGEGEETLVVRLDDRTSGDENLADGYDFDNPDIYDINRGAKAEHRIVIAQGNIAPRVALTLEQDGERRLLIARDGGPVTATAEVIDPNADDSHELDWSGSDNVLTDTDGDNGNETLVFDPVDLNPGRYSLALRATDSAGGTGSRRRHFVVVPAMPVLSEDDDRNNNGLSDAEEGAGDENDNGIPDYRDNAPSPNVLPEEANGTPDYLMECDAGVVCALGRFSALSDTGGSRLTEEDIEAQEGIEPDTSYEPVGGIFDFEVNELPETGQSVSIAIPLLEPVPTNAVYRKYIDGQWRDFVEDEFNQLHSAAGDPGYCPPPGDSVWQEGLAEGHHCVQLTLEDGGPNDADGEANGAVADPGAVSRATDEPDEPDEPGTPGENPDEDPDQPDEPGAEDPDAQDPGYDGEVTTRSSGGGSTGAWLILSLLGLGLLRRRRFSRRLGALIGVPLLSLALMGAPLESLAEEVDPIADMRFELGLYNADSSVGAGEFTRRMAGNGVPITLSQYDVNRRALNLGIEFPLAQEFSLTVGYLNLGEAQARFRTQVGSQQQLQQALEQHYPYSPRGWTIGQKLRLPLHSRVNLLAEVGFYHWHGEVSTFGPAVTPESTEGTDPLLGLGLEVPLNQQVSAGLKFKRVLFDNQQVDLMGATLNWQF